MTTYNTPGVFIEEISTLPASVSAVETAIPAFIGFTEFAGTNSTQDDLLNVPTRITSLLEYQELFGGPNAEDIQIDIEDELDGDGNVVTRTISTSLDSPSAYKLYYALQLFFNNGGGPCYIVSIGDYETPVTATPFINNGIPSLEKADEPTLLVFPDAIGVFTHENPADETEELENYAQYGGIVTAALAHCAKLQDRFTIADVYDNGSNVTAYRGSLGTSFLNYGAAYHPYLNTSLNYGIDESTLTVNSHTSPPENGDLTTNSPSLEDLSSTNPSAYRSILASIATINVVMPPSGAIAGVYARVDSDRGVWKAPANVSLNSVIAPTIKVTSEQQGGLNVDPTSGKSINAIRTFTGKGTLVWGARTFAGNDNEWRYVPVRRLFIFVEESIKKATEFVVFEPNDANTWLRTKTLIENFLASLWREGALAGASPADAFFVRVGLGETMSSQDILEGRMNIEIGMAAVRPAEFIILKFSHKLQES
ncbi:MAG: phage tail sheath C-terminal domain-containing protein [Bacteroidota bacterium]